MLHLISLMTPATLDWTHPPAYGKRVVWTA